MTGTNFLEEIATTQDSENEKQLNSQIDYNMKDVKDALFGEAIVFGERINVIIDSESKGSVISKQFLNRKQQDIDSSAHFRLIDIQENHTCPLGIKHNMQVNIEGYNIGIDIVVTESKNYNIVLGNNWISKVCATLDYNNGLLTILTSHGTVTIAVTCWDNIKNPLQFHPIPQVSIENPSELELEGEDENVESQTFFFNVQQTSNITQIEGDVYPNECLQYWIKKFKITKKDNYPLPRTNEIFDSLGKAQWFTSLDLASGYWQVEMKEEDKSKTAFITRNGMYEFNVIPFGLCNVPGTFQRCMNNILKDMLWKNTMVYLDDVNIYSKTFEEHLQHLKEVLKRVEKAGLKINPEKCHFCTQSLQFLGHIVTNKGILPDPSKVDAIKNYPVPKNLTQLRAFLGLTSYYRRFIKDFSKISTPLYILLKKDIPYE
ncbi:retroviral-like aspartic protease 1 [Rhizophagus clarus]|uniref:Retroviral-like aspartic protease 1 n=1 Tax=Rhizophagus clarus TaxID=94130 RepID=A0A8H3KV90_9GLOM|nr:retroviral-like aspartic protease 1 [Rhizophagus clarus]